MAQIEVITDRDKMVSTGSQDPFGPKFTPEQVGMADRLVVVYSGIKDPGGDFVDWTLFHGNTPVASRRQEGY
ncbi:MAG: hypothetical protein ACOYB2_10750 [Limnohabitans sp.]